MDDGGGHHMQRIGRGRSGVVYLDRDVLKQPIARKIFTGRGLSKAVLYLLTGAPNPYTWCESAVEATVARRRILARLVGYWFDGKLRLPRTHAWRFNEEHRAYEIHTEFIEGHHVPLLRPEETGDVDALRDLVHGVMKPLQRRLEESGFDGLVWQAGRGNPVAASNFMLATAAHAASNAANNPEPNHEADREDDPSSDQPQDTAPWVWVDLESGVPALFAINPLATLRFYLPKSIRHRRWLFDDVDIDKLRTYLESHQENLESLWGTEAVAELLRQVDGLEQHQRAWKSIRRYQRSIAYELVRGRITPDQARHYQSRPLRWYARLSSRSFVRVCRWLARRPRLWWTWLRGIHVKRLAWRVWRFCSSQRFRWRLAQWHVARRARSWSDRKFLDRATGRRLREQLKHDDASAYLTDFAVHLAIKPFVKTLQWWIFPGLWAIGVVNEFVLGVVIVTGGAIGRTVYTSGRLIQATLHRQRRPWVALGMGMLPVVGNAAYPAQLLYCTGEKTGGLARFIVSDTFATMGRSLPIWGGADSLVEHYFNRLGNLFVRLLAAPSKLRATEAIPAANSPVAVEGEPPPPPELSPDLPSESPARRRSRSPDRSSNWGQSLNSE